jgi:hypothetical protein
MRGGSAPVPWVAIGLFVSGSYALLCFIYALADPTFCSRHCYGAGLAYLLLGRWGVRIFFLTSAICCFYIPFADHNQREL